MGVAFSARRRSKPNKHRKYCGFYWIELAGVALLPFFALFAVAAVAGHAGLPFCRGPSKICGWNSSAAQYCAILRWQRPACFVNRIFCVKLSSNHAGCFVWCRCGGNCGSFWNSRTNYLALVGNAAAASKLERILLRPAELSDSLPSTRALFPIKTHRKDTENGS